jgi:hypothetical protein
VPGEESLTYDRTALISLRLKGALSSKLISELVEIANCGKYCWGTKGGAILSKNWLAMELWIKAGFEAE